MTGHQREFTPKSTMACEEGGYRFHFSCELCDKGYTTGKIIAGTVNEALNLARKEARPHFNRCHICGRWICDGHYNIDQMACLECSPYNTNKTKKENI